MFGTQTVVDMEAQGDLPPYRRRVPSRSIFIECLMAACGEAKDAACC